MKCQLSKTLLQQQEAFYITYLTHGEDGSRGNIVPKQLIAGPTGNTKFCFFTTLIIPALVNLSNKSFGLEPWRVFPK